MGSRFLENSFLDGLTCGHMVFTEEDSDSQSERGGTEMRKLDSSERTPGRRALNARRTLK